MKLVLKISCISLLILVVFSGCDLLGGAETVTPADRLTKFETALNQNSRDTIYEQINNSASLYNQIKVSTWWDSNYFSPVYDNFDITNVVVGIESSGIISATASISNSAASWSAAITFKEGTAGDDVWYILSFTIDPNGTPQILIY